MGTCKLQSQYRAQSILGFCPDFNMSSMNKSSKCLNTLIQSYYLKGSLYDWVLEHRLHHAHFGTEKDPFNPYRGFFYAHFINKLVTSHPDHEELLKTIDIKDLEQDPIVMWQKR